MPIYRQEILRIECDWCNTTIYDGPSDKAPYHPVNEIEYQSRGELGRETIERICDECWKQFTDLMWSIKHSARKKREGKTE